MAKVSYRRLAIAMVGMLDHHSIAEVVAAAVETVTASGARLDLERLTPEIERELLKQAGHVVIHATAARALPAATLDKLAAELTKQVGGTDYELDTRIDPSLLGGVQLNTADSTLDLSLRTRLDNIRI